MTDTRVGSKGSLEMVLERAEAFRSPRLELEQYRLPAPVAAEIIWYIGMRHGDIEGKVVADLGCGTGILMAGALLTGASYAVGADLDLRALEDARRLMDGLGLRRKGDLILCDVGHLSLRADTVVQNPPFGVRRREADRAFLRAGLRIAPVVYSLHKGGESIRAFISRFVGESGGRVDEILPLRIKLPPTYHFHAKRFHVFDADLYRIVRG